MNRSIKIARTSSGEYWESVEIPIFRKGGEIRVALWNSANLYAKDGATLMATIAQGRDITEHERAAETIFGYPTEEILGQPLEVIIPERLRESHLKAFRAAAETGKTRISGMTVGFPGLRKDDREFLLELSLAAWRTAEGDFFTAIIRDVTERRRAEEEIQLLNRELQQRITELRTANADLESFSYSVSHDLRSPLAVIDGFSHVLLSDYNDKPNDEGKRCLNIIRATTQKMGQLIDDLLNFSRLGRQQMQQGEINMEELAQIVVTELRSAIPERTVEVEIKPLPTAYGDWSMIRQVMISLVSNAFKFSRHKDPMAVEIGGMKQENETVFYVKDNGAGFDMQYVGKLFGVFQRLHSPEEFEGTGVGLAIVHRIVRRHGGRVWAEAPVNEGATFYFALPVVE